MAARIDAYLESATKRTFAGAIDWPGWARSGRDEEDALTNLAAYRDRYADVLRAAHIQPPAADSELHIVQRLEGGAATDYGVPSASPAADETPLAAHGLERHVRLLEAAWASFDRAAAAARGVDLRTGPRGGGRDRAKIAAHIVDAERAYIGQLGVRAPELPSDPSVALASLHAASVEALRARARGELPDVGARGGKRWTARYFVRRATWHVLDHAWEIEDRSS